jgi:hypothetical protein
MFFIHDPLGGPLLARLKPESSGSSNRKLKLETTRRHFPRICHETTTDCQHVSVQLSFEAFVSKHRTESWFKSILNCAVWGEAFVYSLCVYCCVCSRCRKTVEWG